ncbi:RNA polymerase sigma factor [Mucilaginibacter ginkgonis]|uniref:Sigma-70 family RNA polymerase sigma factor n=1 Tax=Mucilaginibacter ginkgonis TaxID=2682091 RepID=A0A6I4HYI1_9SPHI|nr:sigma-70 family RNA polymerase sigma factor [Mucilaginibacter ginkgonis]QQL49563.1 sigma-70 family RNA polymerase sigma factor [Mucilaginibacter ginkgonis]
MSWFGKRSKPTEVSDEVLLEHFRQSGDLIYLGDLFEKYMPLVFGVCLKYLGDEEVSKDAVMQIFEGLTIKVNKFEIKNFKSWLYVFTRNHCLMQIRAGYRFKFENLDDVMESAFEKHLEDGDKEGYFMSLDKCMAKLNEQQQQCVSLFYLKEKTYKQVAENTGFSMNEVKSFIQNGKRNLKICMENNGG